MAYYLYQTDAFVLGLYPISEASRTYTLFTKDLGMVEAKAQGVRLSKSKLKHALQGLSKTRVSLVKGREYWKIVGAQEPTHYWLNLKYKHERLALVERFLSLVKRLIHGEERNEKVYKTLHLATDFLEAEKEISSEELFLLEIIVVARILSALGYFEPKNTYLEILGEEEIKPTGFIKAREYQKELLYDINSALKNTHL